MSLARGLAHLRAQEHYEAHDELEIAWREAAPAERGFLQGLVHVAVAWHHAAQGNRSGCERQLEKAARRLAAYAPDHRGVDVASLLRQVETARGRAATGDLSLEPVRV
jgi:predicted metal-dependent hydrolase